MQIQKLNDANEKSKLCLQLLRALPDWFGIEQAILDYAEEIKSIDAWAAVLDCKKIGLVSLQYLNSELAELHLIAVHPEYHRKQVGKQLLSAIESELQTMGVRTLQVKTLSDAHPDPYYKKTREFYLAAGFVPTEELKNLWGPENPCLLMQKNLTSI